MAVAPEVGKIGLHAIFGEYDMVTAWLGCTYDKISGMTNLLGAVMQQFSVLRMAQEDLRRRLLRLFSLVPKLAVHRRLRSRWRTSPCEFCIPRRGVVLEPSGLESLGRSSQRVNNTTEALKVEGQLTTDMPSDDICHYAPHVPPTEPKS